MARRGGGKTKPEKKNHWVHLGRTTKGKSKKCIHWEFHFSIFNVHALLLCKDLAAIPRYRSVLQLSSCVCHCGAEVNEMKQAQGWGRKTGSRAGIGQRWLGTEPWCREVSAHQGEGESREGDSSFQSKFTSFTFGIWELIPQSWWIFLLVMLSHPIMWDLCLYCLEASQSPDEATR